MIIFFSLWHSSSFSLYISLMSVSEKCIFVSPENTCVYGTRLWLWWATTEYVKVTFTVDVRLWSSLKDTWLFSCSVTVDSLWKIRGSIIDTVKTQRCCEETEESGPTDGSDQWMRRARAYLWEGLETWRKREGSFWQKRRHSNGVFQFAVAGNERRLKCGQ